MLEDQGAWFYDGKSSRKHHCHVRLDTGRMALEIELANMRLTWRLDQLRGIKRDIPLVLTLVSDDNDPQRRQSARLLIQDEALAHWVIRSRPNLFRNDHLKNAFRRIAVFSGGALAALVLMLFVIVPTLADSLAVMVPRKQEAKLGEIVVETVINLMIGENITSFGERDAPKPKRICADPDGAEALNEMVVGIYTVADSQYDLTIRVVDHSMINAFAAPGGMMVLTRGLIKGVEGQDALAGVIAHEIGHVDASHSLRAILRASGSAGLLSLAIGDVGGGIAAVILQQVITSANSRANEAEADEFAHQSMKKANVSVAALGNFFDLIINEYGGEKEEEDGSRIFDYFASHPPTKERAQAARAQGETQSTTASILTDDQWKKVKRICDTKREDFTITVPAP